MFNDMPQLLDPEDDIDPVTGAPLTHSRRSSFNRNRLSGSFVPVPVAASFAPPYGYAHQGYTTTPFLSPAILSSPQLVPATWVDAYYERFGQRPPAALNNQYAPTPRRRTVQLPSPNVSPFHTLIPLPVLPDEPESQDPRDTWASRFKHWIKGESRLDPHRALNRDIRVNGCFYKRESDISWNISFPPHTVRMRFALDGNESAFDPPLTTCRIVSTLIPWVIELSAPDDRAYVTVMSLVADVYDCLKRPIERNVYERQPAFFQELVDATYQRRCLAIPDAESAQIALDKGIKRVDFLLDKVHFAGLTQVKDMFQTFEIILASKP